MSLIKKKVQIKENDQGLLVSIYREKNCKRISVKSIRNQIFSRLKIRG